MCNFNIPFEGNAADIISKAADQIESVGGAFNRESPLEGNFNISSPIGKIAGTYNIQNQFFEIHIAHKPFLISCGMIEKELKKRLGG